jgi:hypothetical protein
MKKGRGTINLNFSNASPVLGQYFVFLAVNGKP